MFSQRGGGGTGIGAAFEHLLCQTAALFFTQRDILSHLNYFPVPTVGNLTKKSLKKIQMLTYAHTPPPPNIDICITHQIGATKGRIKESGCLIQFYRPYGERGRGGGEGGGARGDRSA